MLFRSDGGINYFSSFQYSETCVTGMVLSILSYFRFQDERIDKLVEHLLAQQMTDGGWNCESYKGATHSSFHTTISVLEGLREYEKQESRTKSQVISSQKRGREFLLIHSLFRSHTTSDVVDPRMTRFSFPPRWHYDIMRALDYFRECNAPLDDRMKDAIKIIRKKCRKDGCWVLQQRHSGKSFFEMEQPGKPSRWNTLRALRILRRYES